MTLNRCSPRMVRCGPAHTGFATISAALADLSIHGDEVIVTPVPRTTWTSEAEEALVAWAELVGYRRMWLPGRVVDLSDRLMPVGTAGTDCPTCGAHWEDGAPAFWEHVRRIGWFPGTCLACGGSLAEWTLLADQERDGGRPGGRAGVTSHPARGRSPTGR